MPEGANRTEWPLAVFTIAVQLSCGLSLATTLVDLTAAPATIARIRPLGLAIFPLVAAGTLCSLLHLGRPLEVWKSLLNLRRSKLSLEVLLTSIFALLAFFYSGLWLMGASEPRHAWGIATAILGLAAVVSSATIYTIPAQPLWNSGWVPASFLSTTLLLGGSASALFVCFVGNDASLRTFLGATLAGSLLSLVSAIWMLKRLLGLRETRDLCAEPEEPSDVLSRRRWLCFGIYVALAGVFPGIVALHQMWPTNKPMADIPAIAFAIGGFLSIISGTLLGRMLMYVLSTPVASVE